MPSSDVNIHIAKNGFKLDGVVKFIAEEGNDGIEGVLAASLPGALRGNFKAKFETLEPNLAPHLTLQVITIIGMWMQWLLLDRQVFPYFLV